MTLPSPPASVAAPPDDSVSVATEEMTTVADDVPASSGSGVAAPLSSGSSSPGFLPVRLSARTDPLLVSEHGFTYSLRSHPRVETLLTIFSSVVVSSVRVYISQSTVLAADTTDPTTTRLIRYGVAPRGIVTHSEDSGVVGYIPSLESVTLSSAVPATASCIWGVGGVPFPPGLQLDLRAVELRHNYVEVLLANCDAVAGDDRSLFVAQVDFTVQCSGQNFGALF